MEILKQMLTNSGLQIHPRQMDMLNEKSVQQLLQEKCQVDEQTQKVLSKANTLQSHINQIVNNVTFNTIDASPKLDSDIRIIIENRQLESPDFKA